MQRRAASSRTAAPNPDSISERGVDAGRARPAPGQGFAVASPIHHRAVLLSVIVAVVAVTAPLTCVYACTACPACPVTASAPPSRGDVSADTASTADASASVRHTRVFDTSPTTAAAAATLKDRPATAPATDIDAAPEDINRRQQELAERISEAVKWLMVTYVNAAVAPNLPAATLEDIMAKLEHTRQQFSSETPDELAHSGPLLLQELGASLNLIVQIRRQLERAGKDVPADLASMSKMQLVKILGGASMTGTRWPGR